VLANLLFFCLVGAGFIALLFGPLVFRLLDPSASLAEQEFVATAFLTLHARFWLAILLVAVAGTVRLAIVSHRVAGPLVRFSRVFRAVRGGDVSMRVKVRTSDYMHAEAVLLDGAVTALRRRLHCAQARAARLEQAIKNVRETIPPETKHDLHAALQSFEEQARRLGRHLERFKTRPSLLGTVVPETQGHSGTGASRPRSRRCAGFTLVEIVLILAIIGTLSVLALPMYAHALDRARVVRAMSEIRATSTEIKRWEIVNGRLPNSLLEAGLDGWTDPWGRPYVYLRIDNLKGKGSVRKDKKLNPINSDFDLYSKGKDGLTHLQVNNKDSLDDIVRANDGGFVGLGRDF
jgi:general secretion pathway protein G